MTQEQKDLLLKDLCGRLPYGVKVQSYNYEEDIETIETLYEINSDGYTSTIECDTLKNIHKPYIFPLSSMTEEQRIDLTTYINARIFVNDEISFQCLFDNTMDRWRMFFEWCDKNHFDYRGLIPMGLANDATGLNVY